MSADAKMAEQIYNAMDEYERRRTSRENVADVLNAVVRAGYSLRGYVSRLSDDEVCELEALRAFREAVVDVAVKRQKGYADRRHGDVLNKECMDEVVNFCKLDSQTRISHGSEGKCA